MPFSKIIHFRVCSCCAISGVRHLQPEPNFIVNRFIETRFGIAALQALNNGLPIEEGCYRRKSLTLYPGNDHNARFLVSFRQQEGGTIVPGRCLSGRGTSWAAGAISRLRAFPESGLGARFQNQPLFQFGS